MILSNHIKFNFILFLKKKIMFVSKIDDYGNKKKISVGLRLFILDEKMFFRFIIENQIFEKLTPRLFSSSTC